MRAAIFRNGEIVVDTLPEPKPAAGAVLVKTLACGICGSDLHARKHAHRMAEFSRHLPGRKPMDPSRDVVFGHEFCCEILDYGPETQRKLKAGTRVEFGVVQGRKGDQALQVRLLEPIQSVSKAMRKKPADMVNIIEDLYRLLENIENGYRGGRHPDPKTAKPTAMLLRALADELEL